MKNYGQIALFLVQVAPPHRYPELAKFMRAQFDALGTQKKGEYGNDTPGQDTLGRIAYALAIFDPASIPHIEARFFEFGYFFRRNVQWGMAGITPAKFADMLAAAGAIDPVGPVELSFALLGYGRYEVWLRTLCDKQNRLSDIHIGNDFEVHSTGLAFSDGYLGVVVALSARIVRPRLDLTHMFSFGSNSNKIRFVHAGSTFEFTLLHDDGDYDERGKEGREAAACFNQFLEHIGHPQRIFRIDDGGFFWEKEIAVFISADKARFPKLIRQLNELSDPALKVEMPTLRKGVLWEGGLSA
jgi:hypothetical protein